MVLGAPRHRYSLRDYLDVEEMSPIKHEYLGGEIVAMAGGTPEHAALSAAVVLLLGEQLRGGPCRPYSSDLRLRVLATGLATYPDAAVVCGEVQTDPESPTHVTNPTVLVQVLSASTEDYDRGEKREHYQRIESLREYVLVSQDRPRVELFSRSSDGAWSQSTYGSGETIDLPSIKCRLSVDELYGAAGLGTVSRP
jgi:Uma2 family endonuclease